MVLLDTHAIVWFGNGDPLEDAAINAIEAARTRGGVLVSPVSGWELGMLTSKGRLMLPMDPVAWLERFVAQPGVRLVPLTLAAAIRSSSLPGVFHGDPADRLLVETAHEVGCPLVTRDHRIQEYARSERHIAVLRC